MGFYMYSHTWTLLELNDPTSPSESVESGILSSLAFISLAFVDSRVHGLNTCTQKYFYVCLCVYAYV